MPRRPQRPCSYPNCRKLCDGQYCEEHASLMNRRYNKFERSADTNTMFVQLPQKGGTMPPSRGQQAATRNTAAGASCAKLGEKSESDTLRLTRCATGASGARCV